MPKPEGNAFQTRLYDAGNAASNRWRNTPFGVTARREANYNLRRLCPMTSRVSKPQVIACAVYHSAGDIGVRAAWSRPISLRADSKLSPCMARPNLFSGD